MPFSITLSGEKVCGGENGGSGGEKLANFSDQFKPKPSWTINACAKLKKKHTNKWFHC